MNYIRHVYKEIIIFIIIYYVLEILQYLYILGGACVTFLARVNFAHIFK